MAKQAKVWTGSAWADLASATTDLTPYSTTAQMNTAIGASAGLTLINSTTFSAAANVSFNNVFSSTYDNYRVVWELTNSTAGTYFSMRMRASGTDNTSANYWNNRGLLSQTSAQSISDTSAQTAFLAFMERDTGPASGAYEIYSPYKTTETTLFGTYQFRYYSPYNQHTALKTGSMSVTTSYDGFTVFPAATSTMTGTIKIYGYKN
jgi:hypothetical protein